MGIIATMQEAVLILCQENNKNEKLKECADKIRSQIAKNSKENKRKINEIAKTSKEEEIKENKEMKESDNNKNARYVTQTPLTSLTKPQIKGIAEYLNKYKMANRKNNNRKSKMRK